ncbi:hypothetical protein EVAR_3201_1 [Eumeta japonica]|uniref:Uncharacterized protein n=1 Tax=Eumeta variegata TaxID=151549 RepID=A0A4C1SXL9_EUMVA|nr:hypothetical protein EVAR_3201_1 [Eumeta japonica]
MSSICRQWEGLERIKGKCLECAGEKTAAGGRDAAPSRAAQINIWRVAMTTPRQTECLPYYAPPSRRPESPSTPVAHYLFNTCYLYGFYVKSGFCVKRPARGSDIRQKCRVTLYRQIRPLPLYRTSGRSRNGLAC